MHGDELLSSPRCQLGAYVSAYVAGLRVLIFSDITPSSWRKGEALIRQFLGPVKSVDQSHSPPTRDTLKQDSLTDSQSRTPADAESVLGTTSMASRTQGNDVLRDDLKHSAVDVHQLPEAATPAECPPDDADEVMDSTDNAGAASGQHLQLSAAANASDLNIQQSDVHHVNVELPGNCWFRLWLH